MRYSRTQIRQAVLMAADHIEQKPERFEFHSYAVPKHGDCKACYLGWIGYFLNLPRLKKEANDFFNVSPYEATLNSDVAQSVFGFVDTGMFYTLLPFGASCAQGKKAANMLRIFAETHYPQETLDGSREIVSQRNETSSDW